MNFFCSVLTLATTDVKSYHQINALSSGSFTGKSFVDFRFTRSVEGVKSPNLLEMNELSAALKVNQLEFGNSEEKVSLTSFPN